MVHLETILPELIPPALQTHHPGVLGLSHRHDFRSEHPELVVDHLWPKKEFGQINATAPGNITNQG